jgi:hypothetical protein
MDNRKDRGVRANPKREGDDHDSGESRVASDSAEPVATVVAKMFEEAKNTIAHG